MSTFRLFLPMSPGRLLLGQEPHQRLRASQNLLALSLMCVFAVVQQLEVDLGLVDQFASNWLTAFNLGTSLLSFLTIRCGLNLRLAPGEPSLTFPQSLCAVTALDWSYAITGTARGALLALLILIIQFAGLFRLSVRQIRLLSLYAFLLLAAVMAWRTGVAEVRYEPQVELIHFAFTVIVLLGANLVSGRFSQMRERLSAQKAELGKALEINRELATRDTLTGLLNRRAMVEMLVRPAPRVQRGDGRMALAIIDIDHFKYINDSRGHNAGDAVLQRFAALLDGEARKGDLLGRWGGEEFLLLMPSSTEQDGQRALDRLRAVIAGQDWSALLGDRPLTFSAGVTSLIGGEDHEAAIERADQALYRAKQAGRDRIELA